MPFQIRSPRAANRGRSARSLDRAFLAVIALNALVAGAIGHHRGQMLPALQGGLLALALALPVLRWQSGRLVARMWLAMVQTGLVAWQIHLASGHLLWHFNVFVSLSLLLAYRDWRPIALMGTGFIVHHIVFDRLLAAGMQVYCLPFPDPMQIAMHAVFVGAQCLALAQVARVLRREWREADELALLVHAMGQDGRIRLNLDVLRADTVAGQRLKLVQQRMAGALREVHEAQSRVARAAQQLTGDSQELRERTLSTAEGLMNAAMCMEQICIIVNDSTAASNEARSMSERAASMADEGGRMVEEVVMTMAQIAQASQRIGDITAVIDGIAFQTNILALNAAVEAARAGEHGRGFAVVAAEVRGLAQRSAAAAREIKTVIGESTETVANGTELVHSAGRSMADLVDAVRRVGDLFVNVTKDTSEHTQGLQMVTQSLQELRDVTQRNVSVADNSQAAARELHGETTRLAEVLANFSLGSAGPAPAPTTPGAPGAPTSTGTLPTPPTTPAPAAAPASTPAAAPAPSRRSAAPPAAPASATSSASPGVEFF